MRRLKLISSMLLLLFCFARAQPTAFMKKLVNASLNSRSELELTPSKHSSSHDFDFLEGDWNLHNKRLKARLASCTSWSEFKSTVKNRKLLNGIANRDISRTLHEGISRESLSLRLFNPQTRLWSLYWVDGQTGAMDPPVTGSFEGSIGIFYGKNIFNDIPVLVMYKWNKTDPDKPEWRQAYSIDNGKTWEWNSISMSQRDDTGPETFMPNIISTDSLEFNTAFSTDENYFYFSRTINKKSRIFYTKKTGSDWSLPEPASFSTDAFSDADPAFSQSGELHFISNRPLNTSDSTTDYDIWKVTPTGEKTASENRWSVPINVKELNSEKDEFYISFTKQGDVYFASSRDGGYGEEDIYYCENKNNKFGNPQNLGDKINSIHSEYDPFITINGSGLLYTSSGREDSFGKGDLYWSVRVSDGWHKANHFEPNINTTTRDFCPYITSDQKYFFYSSNGDIKFMPVEALPEELLGVLTK